MHVRLFTSIRMFRKLLMKSPGLSFCLIPVVKVVQTTRVGKSGSALQGILLTKVYIIWRTYEDTSTTAHKRLQSLYSSD